MKHPTNKIEEFLPILKKSTGFLLREIQKLISLEDIEIYERNAIGVNRARSNKIFDTCCDEEKERYYELIRKLFSSCKPFSFSGRNVESAFYDQGLIYKTIN